MSARLPATIAEAEAEARRLVHAWHLRYHRGLYLPRGMHEGEDAEVSLAALLLRGLAAPEHDGDFALGYFPGAPRVQVVTKPSSWGRVRVDGTLPCMVRVHDPKVRSRWSTVRTTNSVREAAAVVLQVLCGGAARDEPCVRLLSTT